MSILNKELEIFLFNALKDYDFSIYTTYLPNGDDRNLKQWEVSNSENLSFYANSSYFGNNGYETRKIGVSIEVDIVKNTLKIVSVENLDKEDNHMANW